MRRAISASGFELPALRLPGEHPSYNVAAATKTHQTLRAADGFELQLLGECGRGGYGNVSLACAPATRQLYAVKCVLSPTPEADAIRETRAARFAGSPLAAQRILVSGSCSYAVLPLMGEDLHDMHGFMLDLDAGHREALVARFGAQLLLQLHVMHRNGVVHRDIKPENILRRHNEVFLADFGLACHASHLASGHAGIAGTTAFLAPEVTNKQAMLETNACALDLWSLGVTLGLCLNPHLLRTFENLGDLYQDRATRTRLLGRSKFMACLSGTSPKLLHILQDLLEPTPSSRLTAYEALRRINKLRDPLREAQALEYLKFRDQVMGEKLARIALAGCAAGGQGWSTGRRLVDWPTLVAAGALLSVGIGVLAYTQAG